MDKELIETLIEILEQVEFLPIYVGGNYNCPICEKELNTKKRTHKDDCKLCDALTKLNNLL